MSPTRPPAPSDLSSLSFPVTLHSPTNIPATTILLCLHGLGDTNANFSTFSSALNLPQTISLTPRAPHAIPPFFLTDFDANGLPLNGGAGHFHWGDDILLDKQTGTFDADPGFRKAVNVLWTELIKGVLLDKCGYCTQDIIILGFGQGGSAALALMHYVQVLSRKKQLSASATIIPQISKFKAVVTIGGPFPASALGFGEGAGRSERALQTRICAVQVGRDKEEELRERYEEYIEIVRWQNDEMRMPRNQGEILPIMRFFADRLREGYT